MIIQKLTIQDILEITEGKLIKGSLSDSITSLVDSKGSKDSLMFAFKPPKVERELGCIVLSEEYENIKAKNIIKVKSPRLAFAKMLNYLYVPPKVFKSENALLAKSAKVSDNVLLGANVVIGENVEIGSGSVIHSNVVINDNVKIAQNVIIHPNVTVYSNTQIGKGSVIHANSVLGSDGFGYESSIDGTWYKIPHIGGLIIGCNVEIGSATSIDRGTLGDTLIKDGTKIDNQCQIGHNVSLGKNCIIAGCCGIAGSTVLEDNVILGGRVSVADHLHIVSGVVVKGASTVQSSISKAGLYGGSFNVLPGDLWNKCMVTYKFLPKMYKVLKRLEKNYVS